MAKTVVVFHSGYGHTQRVAQFVAQGANAQTITIDADGSDMVDGDSGVLHGLLDIAIVSDGSFDPITVQTGSDHTTITDLDWQDSLTVDASEMLDDKTLTLRGLADVVVNDVQSSIQVVADDRLDGRLVVNIQREAGAELVADTVQVWTGISDTTVNDLTEAVKRQGETLTHDLKSLKSRSNTTAPRSKGILACTPIMPRAMLAAGNGLSA